MPMRESPISTRLSGVVSAALRDVEQTLLDERVPRTSVVRHHEVLGRVAVEDCERLGAPARGRRARRTPCECEVRVVMRKSTGVSNCSLSS